MEVLGVARDRLVAPLHPGRQEPGEGEDDPPDGAGHAEEVDEEEDHGAQRGPRGLVVDVLHVELPVARHFLVPGDESHYVADGHEHVARGQEDDGSLRVLEALHVDEESGDRGESWHEAQHGPKSDPKRGERSLVVRKVGVVARHGAVRDLSCFDPVVKRVTVRVHRHHGLQTLAPRLTRRGRRLVFPRRAGSAGLSFRRIVTLTGVVGGFGQHRGHGGGVCPIVIHAQGVGVALHRQQVTLHPVRPGEAVLPHEGSAARPGSLAHAPARRQRFLVVLQADRGVHAAQEKLQVRGTLDLDQRPELVHLQSRLVLRVVVELVGHVGVVVADPLAQGHGDLLAGDLLGRGAAGPGQQSEGEEQVNPKQVHGLRRGAARPPSASSAATVQINPLSRLRLAALPLNVAQRAHRAPLGISHGVASDVQAVFTLGADDDDEEEEEEEKEEEEEERRKRAFRAASGSQDGWEMNPASPGGCALYPLVSE